MICLSFAIISMAYHKTAVTPVLKQLHSLALCYWYGVNGIVLFHNNFIPNGEQPEHHK